MSDENLLKIGAVAAQIMKLTKQAQLGFEDSVAAAALASKCLAAEHSLSNGGESESSHALGRAAFLSTYEQRAVDVETIRQLTGVDYGDSTRH